MTTAAQEFKNLNTDFVCELFKTCLSSSIIFDVVKPHLKYQFLQSDVQKKLWKSIIDNFDVDGKLPTIGILGQQWNKDKEVIQLLAKIKNTEASNNDMLVVNFEQFIKNSAFVNLHNDVANLYNEGKSNEAIKMLSEESSKIHAFNIKAGSFTTIFRDFERRNILRQHKNDSDILSEKVPFSIRELDNDLRGGGRKGTSALFLARSGGGKSTALKWFGASAARLGKIVVHIQAEGLEDENKDLYDSIWTGVKTDDMEFGNIPADLVDQIKKANKNILLRGGEVIMKTSEQFDSMSLEDARAFIIEVIKQYGRVDLIIFDYLELFTVKGQYGNGDAAERKRRTDIAQKMTNMAVEFKCFVITATQATDISSAEKHGYNDPDWTMTRSHINEFKGCLRPFSYFITINQTDQEYAEGQYRLFTDKLRRHKARKVYKIWGSMDNARFYDAMKTNYELSKK